MRMRLSLMSSTTRTVRVASFLSGGLLLMSVIITPLARNTQTLKGGIKTEMQKDRIKAEVRLCSPLHSRTSAFLIADSRRQPVPFARRRRVKQDACQRVGDARRSTTPRISGLFLKGEGSSFRRALSRGDEIVNGFNQIGSVRERERLQRM